jgi:hypothetical protein
MIDDATAECFMALTLGHVGREYPNHIAHLLAGPQDVAAPAALHPIFHGSLDWHSCVHGWWQLLTLARRHPALVAAEEVRSRADAAFTADKVAGELAYFQRPDRAGFERPYGWAWLLMLHAEAARHDAGWADALAPLARHVVAGFRSYLPKLTYPIRAGAHFNTAFALILARDGDPTVAPLIDERARVWFGEDRDCQAWEPGGDEFLSPALCEALLMARVLGDGFAAWFDRFLPRLASGEPATLFTPAHVSDRADGKIAHLDGLNLSRAWCWRGIARALGAGHPVGALAEEAAKAHLTAALPHLADDYMGEHWLATFALLAML